MYGERTNRPRSGALFQQQLKAWKPLMTYKDASIFFIVTGLILVGIGVPIYFADLAVHEIVEYYTDCIRSDGTANATCSSLNNWAESCSCKINVAVNQRIPHPVYFYYGITKYYQNHRLLLNSYAMSQLTGKFPPENANCKPLWKYETKYYAPCGSLPNIIFNDTFKLEINNVAVPWTDKGIALKSDLNRYANPKDNNWNDTIKPPNWAIPIYETPSKGYKGDESLMVWMRGSPLPSIRKLHHILIPTGIYSDGLPIGNYSLIIGYNYPVKSFDGTKSFIISNASWMGGKSWPIAILYFITGSIEILIGLILIPIHVNYIISSLKTKSALMSVEM